MFQCHTGYDVDCKNNLCQYLPKEQNKYSGKPQEFIMLMRWSKQGKQNKVIINVTLLEMLIFCILVNLYELRCLLYKYSTNLL